MSQFSMKPRKWLLPLFFLASLNSSVEVLAHGAKITYEEAQGIRITANYDQGQPMANAQVVIYAPNDPATPWLKGETNAEGQFGFVPDPNQSGSWDVKVRQSGHGALISIPVGAIATSDSTIVASQSGYTPMQKILMIASGVWGFVGTAMFFARKHKR